MKKLYVIVFLLCSLVSRGQQEIQISQYMFNGLFLNPAYSGSHNYTTATALYRAQWTGFDGAPTTQTLGIDGSILSGTMGLGMTFSNDQIGDTRQTEFAGIYSYHIFLNDYGTTKLSFGIKAGFADYTARLSETTVWDEADPVFSQNITNAFIPKVGAGVYVYSKMWYAGISVPTLFAGDDDIAFNIDGQGNNYFEKHYYLNGGIVINGGSKLKIKPSFLLKYEPTAPLTADINVNLLFNNVFWLGASYRIDDAIVAILEYNITPNLRLGYSYDITTTRINKYSGGSHEVMLGYQFGKEVVKTKTPRYF